jgi:Glycosyltransferase family 25 (LPS biosynthesis protein)
VAGDELAEWWRRLRPGGLLAGHGYSVLPGVAAAIDGFVAERGLANAFRRSGNAWMIHKSLTIDAAYCINLAHRPDRRIQAETQFGDADIADRVEFFTAIDGLHLAHPATMSHGQAGCTASHLSVMRTALESGYRNVLIFEDDVDLVPGFSPQFSAALARCPAGYDLCYLGITCVADWGNFLYPLDDLLSRVGHAFGTHAYLVNLERFAMIDAALVGLHNVVDQWYARGLQPRSNCYCCTPYLAYQRASHSDITGTHYTSPRAIAQYVWR